MLASVGRVAAQRLAPRRIAASASGYVVRVGRLAAYQPVGSSASLGAAFKRTYAAAAATTAGRPKKTAAGSTATATKAKAKPRKTAAAAATKKAAPKKKTTKAKTVKKTKKPAVPKPKKKAPLSEEKKRENKLTLQKKLLKEKAMLFREPKQLPQTSWTIFLSNSVGSRVQGQPFLDSVKQASEAFKSLSAAEMQKLADTGEQNKLTNAARYKAWVESHTPLQIAEALSARRLLKSKFDYPKGRKTVHKIRDDRLPKRPSSPYMYFSKSKAGAEDIEGANVVEKQKAIANVWRQMSPAEKEPFEQLGKADTARYIKEAEALGLRKSED